MAQLVAAVACAHGPMMAVRPEPDADGSKARIYAAFAEARARLARAHLDSLIVVSNEHLQNFFFDNWPALCVAYAEAMEGPFERNLPIPRATLRGHGAFGAYLVEAGLNAHFDLASSQEFQPDHGIMLPLQHLRPEHDLPVTIVLQNCVEPPLPTLRRCHEFGRFLGEAVARWPRAERVAVLGFGGLSHWIGVKRMGEVNPTWDRWVIDSLRTGRGETVLAVPPEAIARDGGNGGEEVRNWLTVAGAAGDRPAELLAYEAIPDWLIGAGVLYWDLA
jgi:protocatechuate 4,5-dioxygenase beta chain